MPGIDKSRIINLLVNEDEWLCGICLSVFITPLVLQCCQQTYCEDCIKQWISTQKRCPNCRERLTTKKLYPASRLVKNILNTFKIKCEFFEYGCKEEMCYERYIRHIVKCSYNPQGICGECGEKNGLKIEHNCLEFLLAKYPLLQCLTTKNKELSDKILIFKQESEFLKQKINKISFTNNFQLNWLRILQVLDLKQIQQDLVKGKAIKNGNLIWSIEASITKHLGFDYLSVFLHCNSKDSDWSCLASVNFSIIKNTENKKDNNERRFSRIYTNKMNNWGYRLFMLVSFIENEKKPFD